MAERTIPLPAHLLRRVVRPVALGAVGVLVATIVSSLVRRARAPALPRMSDDWVRAHERSHSDEWHNS